MRKTQLTDQDWEGFVKVLREHQEDFLVDVVAKGVRIAELLEKRGVCLRRVRVSTRSSARNPGTMSVRFAK